MLAVKKSRKRNDADSPSATMSRGMIAERCRAPAAENRFEDGKRLAGSAAG